VEHSNPIAPLPPTPQAARVDTALRKHRTCFQRGGDFKGRSTCRPIPQATRRASPSELPQPLRSIWPLARLRRPTETRIRPPSPVSPQRPLSHPAAWTHGRHRKGHNAALSTKSDFESCLRSVSDSACGICGHASTRCSFSPSRSEARETRAGIFFPGSPVCGLPRLQSSNSSCRINLANSSSSWPSAGLG
jgi:hypothetical protein